MSVTKEDLGGNRVRLTITVPASVFQDSIEKVYRKNRGTFVAQGFRKGHVPRPFIEKQNGADFFYRDALELLLPESLTEAYQEAELDVVAPADNLQVESWGRDDGVVYTAEVYVRPTVELGKYAGLDVTEHHYTVKDKDVDNLIEDVRRENMRWMPKEEEAADGDMVSIDYVGRLDGREFDGGSARAQRLILGSHRMIDGFEEQIVGMKQGDDRTITVTFPEDYPDSSLAGKETVFDIHVNNVERGEVPELDDDFAEDVSGLPTLAEYRESVRKDMQTSMDTRTAANLEGQLVDQVVKDSQFDVPPPMIDRQRDEDVQQLARDLAMQGHTLDSYMKAHNATPEMMQTMLQRSAEQTVRTSLVLAKLVDTLDTAATEEEIDAQLGEMAERSNITLDEAKANVTREGVLALADRISVSKTLGRLKELANVTVVEDETPDILLGITAGADRPEEDTTEQTSDNDRTVEE